MHQELALGILPAARGSLGTPTADRITSSDPISVVTSSQWYFYRLLGTWHVEEHGKLYLPKYHWSAVKQRQDFPADRDSQVRYSRSSAWWKCTCFVTEQALAARWKAKACKLRLPLTGPAFQTQLTLWRCGIPSGPAWLSPWPRGSGWRARPLCPPGAGSWTAWRTWGTPAWGTARAEQPLAAPRSLLEPAPHSGTCSTEWHGGSAWEAPQSSSQPAPAMGTTPADRDARGHQATAAQVTLSHCSSQRTCPSKAIAAKCYSNYILLYPHLYSLRLNVYKCDRCLTLKIITTLGSALITFLFAAEERSRKIMLFLSLDK